MKTIPSVLTALLLSPALRAAQLEIGWGEADITPPPTRRIPLDGQYYQRIATGIHTRLAFVALAVRSGDEYFLTASVDNVTVNETWVKTVRTELKKRVPAIDPRRVTINCVHSHCAPMIGDMNADFLLPEASRRKGEDDSIWGSEAFTAYITPLAVGALEQAWKNLRPGSIARAKGEASIGHSRVALYRDGHGEMYGDTTRADFAGMADGEDPNVEMLFTYDAKGKWSGAVFNVACPAQVMEVTYKVSGDIAGVLREKMRKLNGTDFHVIYQPAASGCQSPRDLVRGTADTTDGWHEDTCELQAEKLYRCALGAKVFPKEKESVVRYDSFRLSVPRRRVSAEEIAFAKKELAALRAKRSDAEAFQDFLAEVHAKEAKGGPGPYDSKYHPFVLAEIDKGVLSRAADQDARPNLDFEVNVFRLGDVAFATFPFEAYLIYGQMMKARSAAKQTFVMELCNGDYGYIPSPAVIKSRSYGSGVNNGEIGPDGGYMLADEVVKHIRKLF